MLIETVNLHIWPKCDLTCLYCYETFPTRPRSMPLGAWCAVLDELVREGVVRVTFSGGEPTLHPDLLAMLEHATAVGLQASIITNGARLTDAQIARLDLVGMTLDSDDRDVLQALGRTDAAGRVDYRERFQEVARRVHASGVRLKVNTVVTALNSDADLSRALIEAMPFKWKPMQFTRIAGENDAHADRLAIDAAAFDAFVARHREPLERAGIWVAAETEETIRSSYAMIDPTGRAFQTRDGTTRFSDPVLEVGLRRALEQVGGYDRERFLARGGHVDVRRLPVLRG